MHPERRGPEKPQQEELLRLLQLADTSFPTGGYAFSNGLEALVHLGLVGGEPEIEVLIRVQIEEGLAGIELPAVWQAHAAAREGRIDRLDALDELVTALKPVGAFRAASLKVGRRFLESAVIVVDDPVVESYRGQVRRGEAGHYATAWGVVCGRGGIEAEAAALAFGSIALHGQTAAAVRLGLIGQAAALRIATSLHPALVEAVRTAGMLGLDEMGAYQPLLDVAGLRQPSMESRLFAS